MVRRDLSITNRVVAAAGACVAVLAVTLLGAAPASAHSELVSSTPAADATIDTLPALFSITMSEDLLDLTGDGTGFALQVTDAAGRYYGDGCLSVAGATVSMGASLGEPGVYRLAYQTVSVDGHTVSAEFAFTWAGEATGPGGASAPVCGQAATAEPTATGAPGEPTPGDPQPQNEAAPLAPILVGAAGLLALGAVIALVIVRGRRRIDPGS